MGLLYRKLACKSIRNCEKTVGLMGQKIVKIGNGLCAPEMADRGAGGADWQDSTEASGVAFAEVGEMIRKIRPNTLRVEGESGCG